MGLKVGAGGEPNAGSTIHWSKKAAIVCSLKNRKGSSVLVRSRVIDSSLTPSIALCVHPSGTIHPIENYQYHKFVPVKADLAFIDVSRVCIRI